MTRYSLAAFGWPLAILGIAMLAWLETRDHRGEPPGRVVPMSTFVNDLDPSQVSHVTLYGQIATAHGSDGDLVSTYVRDGRLLELTTGQQGIRLEVGPAQDPGLSTYKLLVRLLVAIAAVLLVIHYLRARALRRSAREDQP